MNCHMCGCELAGDLDTFGEIGEEVCQACWGELIEATASTGEQWYGMAPHDHVQDEYGWT